MKLIVGLGNPGKKYQNTRHNLGFLVIDTLSKELKIKLDKINKTRYWALCGKEWMDELIVLAKPMTFINLSGKAVGLLVEKYKVDLKDTIVICDDLNLDLGVLKIKRNGSSGGHKGLESIIEHLQSNKFPRVRLGIGKPSENIDLSSYVLSPFKKKEMKIVDRMIKGGVEAIKIIFKEGLERAMNKYNKRNLKIT